MKLSELFVLNNHLSKSNRFTFDQWEEIIDNAFSYDKSFDNAVESFYTDILGFDYNDAEDLITDIQNGDGDGFERFINDIVYYYEN